MEYSAFQYKDTYVSVALFGNGRREAHAIITPRQSDKDSASQIRDINEAAEKLIADTHLAPAFRRYLLSDPSNQAQYLPEAEDCATSVIGQSPLDGTKAALLLILEEDALYENLGGGVWKNQFGKVWAGDNNLVPAGDSFSMAEGYLKSWAKALAGMGASLKDNCLRTWFFVRDIDNNYKGVVGGRNHVFSHHDLTPRTHFIASTGIAGKSPVPSRLVAFSAYADTRVKQPQITYLYGKSHLNPTYEYGVAFERGAAVDYADRRHVFISGTASIDNNGKIVAPGNVKAQAERMLENISVLLAEGDCCWGDVAHMVVYLRDIADYQLVRDLMEERFPRIPKAIVLAPVCRPGWLIETECMAIKKADNPGYEPF